ncbi:MAG: transcriptional regulator [Planctomycetota bacterium]
MGAREPVLPDFDPVLLSQARLGAVAILMARDEASFAELEVLLGLTRGNLGQHLRRLEEAGYVTVRKEFVDRRPRTSYRLAAKGRRAFEAHVATLRRIAEDGKG